MSEDPRQWSSKKFIAFLLLHASHADYDYSASERLSILNIVSTDVLEEAQMLYDRLSEYQRLDYLLKAKESHIRTEGDKEKVLRLLTHHFAADGETSRPEKTLLNFLDRLL